MHRSSSWITAAAVLLFVPIALADTSVMLPSSTENRTIVGDTIVVRDNVVGDLVVAGRSVRVLADVGGDLLVAGGDVDIQGDIAGDARIAGWNVALRGRIGGEAMVSSGSFLLGPQGSVGADLRVTAMDARFEGRVEKNGYLDVARLEFRGKILGDARIDTSELALAEDAAVSGNLEYAAPIPDPSVLDPHVGGTATAVARAASASPAGSLTEFSFILLAMSVAFALFLLWLLPPLPSALLGELREHPLRSALYGVLGIFAVFPILVLVFSGIGTQIGVLLMSVWGIALSSILTFTGIVLAALTLRLLRIPTTFWMYAASFLLVFALMQLLVLLLPPVLLVFLLFGIVVLGAVFRAVPSMLRVTAPVEQPKRAARPELPTE